tara:strand:+ start:192 stop:428 length:237 start_codon:yes stop_codon:yes gene_type:complete
MITEENLMDARYHIILLQEKQDKIFQELLDEVKDKHKEKFPDLEHELVDFCFNNLYYSKKDINRFISKLYSKEILLEI